MTKEMLESSERLETIEATKKKMLIERFRHFNYNKIKAADSLGISVRTFYNWLDMFGIKGKI